MENIIIMDAALMGQGLETTTQKNRSKRKDVGELDSPLDDDATHDFASPSTSTLNKTGTGVATEEMDDATISGSANVQQAHDMPLYTPEHMMDHVVQPSIMDKCGTHTGVTIHQHKLNMEEQVQVEHEVFVENQGQVDIQGPEVQVQVDEGGAEERPLTRPSKKRGNRTVKASKATRTPYVAEPEVKDSKLTKEECQLIEYVMKPARKKEHMEVVVSMEGMLFKPSRTDLRNVFKERGRMSNLVMDSMILWLMKDEKKKSPKKKGVPIPTRHMFSSTFVGNLRNLTNLKKQTVLTDQVDPNILGYDVAMCNLLFLPILLATCDHWFCVVINLVEKRIDVLDSMKLKSQEKTLATADVVSALFSLLKQTRSMDSPWNNWIIHHPDVPQQNNIFDCGFYTLRFMEHWTGGRMNTRELEGDMGIDMRKRLLVRFILSPHNNRRDDVLQMCR